MEQVVQHRFETLVGVAIAKMSQSWIMFDADEQREKCCHESPPWHRRASCSLCDVIDKPPHCEKNILMPENFSKHLEERKSAQLGTSGVGPSPQHIDSHFRRCGLMNSMRSLTM
ncbi:hypothetical protein OUZ56_023932 [Daphnia magna]|uniref:Uncharacterized protein n=1 Tax=Daphnia magna TaxID=35525 RepID=A0ABR0B066_9CRUS|nr:hypothetical protein OUZ56_023932 [Daphnia magna]